MQIWTDLNSMTYSCLLTYIGKNEQKWRYGVVWLKNALFRSLWGEKTVGFVIGGVFIAFLQIYKQIWWIQFGIGKLLEKCTWNEEKNSIFCPRHETVPLNYVLQSISKLTL